VVLVLLVVLVAGVMSANRVVAWGTRRLGEQVLKALPVESSAAERERLRQSLECAVRMARENRASEHELGALMRACRAALVDHAVTPVEVEKIRLAADRCCGLPREEAIQ